MIQSLPFFPTQSYKLLIYYSMGPRLISWPNRLTHNIQIYTRSCWGRPSTASGIRERMCEKVQSRLRRYIPKTENRILYATLQGRPPRNVLVLRLMAAAPARRIMSLKEPLLKMSKSHADPRSRILVNDDHQTISEKLRFALTDSMARISYDPINRPGVSNLLVSRFKNVALGAFFQRVS